MKITRLVLEINGAEYPINLKNPINKIDADKIKIAKDLTSIGIKQYIEKPSQKSFHDRKVDSFFNGVFEGLFEGLEKK